MIFQQFNVVERLDVLTNVLIGRLAEYGGSEHPPCRMPFCRMIHALNTHRSITVTIALGAVGGSLLYAVNLPMP